MGNRAAFVVAFLLRAIYGGMQIVTKNAFNEGMSTTVFVFYRHLVAILFLVPVAFVLERISGAINIYGLGLSYASATSSSAIFNLLPAVAFFLAVLLRMETLNLKRFHGIAKVCGILFSLAGVIVLAFYQGPEMKSFNHHHLFHHGSMLEAYPSKLLNTTLQMIFATIQCFFIALAAERDFAKWRLGLDARLIAVVYSGILVSGVAYYMQVWVIDKSGPVFLAMTMPITLLVTIILSLFLGEAVTLGSSIFGGVIMVGGLYSVLWAKRSEHVDVIRKQQMAAPAEAAQV
ncbi:WAT1-related protein [Panicum miliaceum]|uniref:WAT1-related protein n=1 Tax=Panicum miliaceum TaxID=4540 RepID=A0A3L6SQB3_PANMI|nr:WAT1-related protein [Panicum miliaceum]